jgi:serine/threonine-protein kinase RsbW
MGKLIKLKSSLDSLIEVERLVDELSEKVEFNTDVYANILVALSEAVKNAIIHGNKMDESQNVALHYSITDSHITFIVIDNGIGFNYYSVPDPTLPENIEKEYGRGIYLMNALADDVIYNDKGNEVSLKFYIQ